MTVILILPSCPVPSSHLAPRMAFRMTCTTHSGWQSGLRRSHQPQASREPQAPRRSHGHCLQPPRQLSASHPGSGALAGPWGEAEQGACPSPGADGSVCCEHSRTLDARHSPPPPPPPPHVWLTDVLRPLETSPTRGSRCGPLISSVDGGAASLALGGLQTACGNLAV